MSSPRKLAFLAALVIGLAISAAAAFGLRQEGTAFAGSSLIDSDFDGCNDTEEVVLGLDPNNFFDFPDFGGPQGSRNPDGVIDAVDGQSVAFRWATEAGDPYYDVYFDRHDGTGANGPNGEIDIMDLQVVYGRFGMACQGVPAPDLVAICQELAVEAIKEGVGEFECSEDPLPTQIGVSGVDIKKRIVQVAAMPNKAVNVKGLDLEMNAEPETVPPSSANTGGMPAGQGLVEIPPECYNVTCRVMLTNSWEWRNFAGVLVCSKFSMEQRYKVYRPWGGIFDVLTPIAGATSTLPCWHEGVSANLDGSNIPFSAVGAGHVTVKAGIPTPWGPITTFTSDFTTNVWFDGFYNYEWTWVD